MRAGGLYVDDVEQKIARLVYNICKNHYLPNGNKRTAVMIFISCLTKYELITVDAFGGDKIEKILLDICKSDSNQREEYLDKLVDFIHNFDKFHKEIQENTLPIGQ